MLELTGIASVLRALGVLYWLAALAAIAAALYFPKDRARKAVSAAIVVALFGVLPFKDWINARERDEYARAAWAHFRKLCAEKSGEKIYKTYTGVKSVLVIKPLPPATEKDLFDQYWYGDPYSASAHSRRGELEAAILASPTAPIAQGAWGSGFDFVEFPLIGTNKHVRLEYNEQKGQYKKISSTDLTSRFGISWEDISTTDDRHYWVASSRLQIVDLTDKVVIAERIGYYIESGFGARAGQRRPWVASRGPRTTCPEAHDWSDRWFVLKVLQPSVRRRDGK